MELTPSSAAELACRLRRQARALREQPIRAIIDGLARVHADWAEEGSIRRKEAVQAIAAHTGYPPGVIDASLCNLFLHLDAAAMERWLLSTGTPLVALECDAPSPKQPIAVFGPRLTVVVSSGNVPGAALPSVLQSLLLKSPTLVKCAAAEPFLLPAYAASIAEELPELAAGLVVTRWPGGSEEIEAAVLSEAEALIAYGGDETLRSLRRHLPLRARFLGYGHRLSFSAVARELLSDTETAREAARRAALDLAMFDQQGCYSPQVTYVEEGSRVGPEVFGALLAEELAALERTAPRVKLPAAEASAIHQYRARVEMRAVVDPAVRIWSSLGGTQWTVALTPREPLHPGSLNRTAVLHPVTDLSLLPELVSGQEPYLLAAALGAPEPRRSEIARALAAAGLCRICELGRAQLPGEALHHDGVSAIAALARFVTLEPEGASRGAASKIERATRVMS